MEISKEQCNKAMQCLVDNGIDEDEAPGVLQALGYTLLDEELEEKIDWDFKAKIKREFLIEIEETVRKTVRVEATDEDEAKALVNEALDSYSLLLNRKDCGVRQVLHNVTEQVEERYRNLFEKIN